jgi:hypothetical protein
LVMRARTSAIPDVGQQRSNIDLTYGIRHPK